VPGRITQRSQRFRIQHPAGAWLEELLAWHDHSVRAGGDHDVGAVTVLVADRPARVPGLPGQEDADVSGVVLTRRHDPLQPQ